MVWASGEASACSGRAMRGCCGLRPSSACCCERPDAVSNPVAQAVSPAPAGDRRISPPSPCECRAGGRTDPAAKPFPTSPRHRTGPGHDRDAATGEAFEAHPAVRTGQLAAAAGDPLDSSAPLYLRTSRLLI
jgi:hypothetical protein